MVTITLVRKTIKGKAVYGTMTLPFEQPIECTTLENADYLIPAGTYPLKKTWSPRFKKPMPEICEVPDRSGIRIHMGTKPEHSEGCVLVDYATFSNLTILLDKLMYHDYENDIRINIRNEGLEESTRGDSA